ncbi:bifunctional dihydrofolate reductase-thymidylate synthase-like [Saccostrea echinata]|uniref:bifunctional dihydrofolate reductase-thymidylate synthase-like n=1 Tax=Saccostrea echinata TaxID=191078 RepID=UPI002A80B3D5|nr:bifunctional dihydrofolate reductase-thymidylate synthase-like [Saccostrea echinata]
MSTKLNLVVAACNNRGIGKDGQLPWRLKKDMEFFKKITTQTKDADKKNAVVMGRKTWYSIPEKFRPLPNRINIILSTTMSHAPEGTYVAKCLDEAVSMVTGNGILADKVEGVHIIGGSSVYKAAFESNYPCRIYLTRVLADFDCDTFLPEFDLTVFKKIENCEDLPKERMTEKNIDFVFEVYEKIQILTSVRVKNEMEQPGFYVMAAMCRGRGVGYKGKLPWRPLKKDYDYYMELTSRVAFAGKKCVNIQGRKTWEGTGDEQRKRKNVFNIVITRKAGESLQKDPDVHKTVSSLDEAVQFCLSPENRELFDVVWILGGQKVYEEAIESPFCKRIYLTEVLEEFPADTFFPYFDEELYKEISLSDVHEEGGVKYQFKVYERLKL